MTFTIEKIIYQYVINILKLRLIKYIKSVLKKKISVFHNSIIWYVKHII